MSGKMIYVISGPSGCGKSTLIRRVLARLDGVRFSVSHTTREQRESEVEGKDYYFVSQDRFLRLVKKKAFVEWAIVHGAYYGTSRHELTRDRNLDVILDIDVQGAAQVRKKVRTAVFIFVLPPSFRELRKRIEKRGLDSAAAIRKRLATARKEVRSYTLFDYVVVNDRLETAGRELESILRCRRARLAARRKSLGPILKSFLGKG
jgi:guanylate kinase